MKCIQGDMNTRQRDTPQHFTGRRCLALIGMAVLGIFLARPIVRAQATPPPDTQESEDNETFDPLRAYKDMKVGDFYYGKGNYEAAIKRYEDAARHRPHFAIPYLKIGKAYEKKHDPKSAIAAYKKYLEILPKGKEAGHARKQIEKLQRELEAKPKG